MESTIVINGKEANLEEHSTRWDTEIIDNKKVRKECGIYWVKGNRPFPSDRHYYLVIDGHSFTLSTDLLTHGIRCVLGIFNLATAYNRERSKYKACLENCDAEREKRGLEILERD